MPRRSKKRKPVSNEDTVKKAVVDTGSIEEKVSLHKDDRSYTLVEEPQPMNAKDEERNIQAKFNDGIEKQDEFIHETTEKSTTTPTYNEFVGRQYTELHELKRMYNNMIFQAPTILVAVVGVAFAGADKLTGDKDSKQLLVRLLPYLGLALSIFSFILSYWAYRSRVLLQAIERSLSDIDQTFGIPVKTYPFQLKKPQQRKRISFLNFLQHSTIQIILFMFLVTFAIFGVSIYYIIKRVL